MTTMTTEKRAPQTGASAHAPQAKSCGESCAPTHDDIAQRAYDIYVKAGRKQGQCKQNWQQAEQSLHDQNNAAHNSPQHGTGACTSHAPGAR